MTEHVIDLVEGDLVAELHEADADAVVHLGLPVDRIDPYLLAAGRAAAEARAVLDAASRAGVAQVVVLSSTLVYGALASNAVPLTEEAVVHPDHAFRPAVELAEIEREVIDWREEPERPATAVLRCAPVVAEGSVGWLAAELHRSLAYPVEDHDPPFQYLHAADLGDAIAQVLEGGFAGVANVAPDGWLDGAGRRALEARPRVRVPAAAARFAASLRGAARDRRARGHPGVRHASLGGRQRSTPRPGVVAAARQRRGVRRCLSSGTVVDGELLAAPGARVGRRSGLDRGRRRGRRGDHRPTSASLKAKLAAYDVRVHFWMPQWRTPPRRHADASGRSALRRRFVPMVSR